MILINGRTSWMNVRRARKETRNYKSFIIVKEEENRCKQCVKFWVLCRYYSKPHQHKLWSTRHVKSVIRRLFSPFLLSFTLHVQVIISRAPCSRCLFTSFFLNNFLSRNTYEAVQTKEVENQPQRSLKEEKIT